MGWWTAGALAAVAFCVVLPDSRFAGVCCILLLLVRLSGRHRSVALVGILPLATCAALLLFGEVRSIGATSAIGIVSDDLSGRLSFSASLLASWSLGEWLALLPSPVYTSDTGYAYLISQIGLPAAMTLWLSLTYWIAPKAKGRDGQAYATIYITTSLCVGASLFSIKSAALLWFLVGASGSVKLEEPLNQIAARRSGRALVESDMTASDRR